MTFGRPTMLQDAANIPIPLTIDDEFLRSDGEEGLQPMDVPSRLGLFVSSCKLFEHLAEILRTFYTANPEPDDLIEIVLRLNRRLDSFAKSVPDYLQTSEVSPLVVSEKNSCVSLQQQVLYCRYFYPVENMSIAHFHLGFFMCDYSCYGRFYSPRPVIVIHNRQMLARWTPNHRWIDI